VSVGLPYEERTTVCDFVVVDGLETDVVFGAHWKSRLFDENGNTCPNLHNDLERQYASIVY
jgi:hypothetical protein